MFTAMNGPIEREKRGVEEKERKTAGTKREEGREHGYRCRYTRSGST